MPQIQLLAAVLLGYFWRFKFFRYMGNHGWIGIINFTIVGLMLVFGYNHHSATIAGHIVHIVIAFFVDRRSTYISLKTTLKRGGSLYAFVEVVSFSSILVVLYVLVDLLGWYAFFVRVVIAAPLATAISYYGNDYVTFRKQLVY